MYRKFFVAICILFSLKTTAQTVDEILTTYEIKNGGKEKFETINTLQYSSTLKMNMMGMPIDINISTYIETGKLFRKEMGGMMGMKGSYTLITDTAAFNFTPTLPSFGEFGGMEGGVKKMEPNLFLQSKNKLNAMHEFDVLMNCKAKGLTPEFLGKTKIEKVECFKIKLTDKAGVTSIYFIDANTYLLNQIELSGKQMMDQLGINGGPMADMMGGKIDKQKMTIIYVQFAEIETIKFPTKLKLQLGAVDIDIENNDIQVNQSIDKKWYSN